MNADVLSYSIDCDKPEVVRLRAPRVIPSQFTMDVPLMRPWENPMKTSTLMLLVATAMPVAVCDLKADDERKLQRFSNSIGMKFVRIPAGGDLPLTL